MEYRSRCQCATDRRYAGQRVDEMVAPREGDCEKIGDLVRDLLGPHVNGVEDAILPELRSRIAFLLWENLPEELQDYLIHTESDYVLEIAEDRWDLRGGEGEYHIDDLPNAREMLETPPVSVWPHKFIEAACERLRELGDLSPTFRDLIKRKMED